ncbi:MAG: peptide chain release factor 2 [Eubacteriales bacterium]|nr:peptide chain release factor 2 [Eubacteriales bacterium]
MIQTYQAEQKIKDIARMIHEAGDGLDQASLQRELDELHNEMSAPDFWDNPEQAQKVNKQLKNLQDKLDIFKDLQSRLEDAHVMLELGAEDAELMEELDHALHRLENDADAYRLTTLLKGKYDANNAILSLQAGAGGTEAQDWAQMLYRAYTRWCERRGFSVKLLDLLDGEEAGIKSVSFLVEGSNAYGFLKAEKGVHRLVRISPFDSNARRHTSFASVEVMPEVENDADIQIRPEDLRVDTYRSSGAGGQHVNKTESAIRITHVPTGFVAACQTERSQIQNRETAMKMLYSMLAEQKEQQYRQEMAKVQGEQKKIEWGSQIRSYVFCPYTMVKDHRTGAETSNVDAVMDGDLDMFINAYLREFAE